jgi:dTDP-4-dehydrorhamnose 3,5-epimerase
MPLIFSKTKIPGLILITPHQAKNEHGYFCKYFEREVFRENGLPADFSESNMIMAYKKGNLRGLHYQSTPSQARLFYVITGSVFYVTLDLRRDSDTFGKYEGFFLSEDQPKAIYAPEEFAYGFLSLEDNTIISYQSTGEYIPENCNGIIWNDVRLNIQWPIDYLDVPLIISEKDKLLQTFDRYRK